MIHSFLRIPGVRTSGLRRFSVETSINQVSHKTAFMFPGQGAQYVGMAKEIAATVPAAKLLFEKASNILGYNLLTKCVDGPKSELDSTVIAQPAIFVASMAALERLRIADPAALESCTVALGLSLGEYSALCYSGVFTFEEGVKLTKVRGEAMQHASDLSRSSMASVLGLDVVGVQRICDAIAERTGKHISIGNYLVNGNYAVSGATEAIEELKVTAPSMGATSVVPLAVAGAFHTKLMEPAVQPLQEALKSVSFKRPSIPVISNVDAKVHWDPEEIKEALVKQVTHPVQWEQSMNLVLKSSDFQKAYEIGPGSVCRGILKKINRRAKAIGVEV